MDGIINLLKPPGITSAQAVAFLKKNLKIKKIGHTGTLDPEAAGVLPVCIGKATKIVDYIINQKKSYRVELILGIDTDTQDIYGNVINTQKNINVSEQDVKDTLNNFCGYINQTPPMYSAIRYNGKRLYELARKGITIKRKARTVKIYDIKIYNKIDNNIYLLDVMCSKGTYMRTLCHDIGQKLGCGAVMGFLLRTQTGIFNLENTYTFEEITELIKLKQLNRAIIPMDYALDNIGTIELKKHCIKKVINGNRVEYENILKISDKQQTQSQYYKIYIDTKFFGIGCIKTDSGKKFVCIKKLLV